MSATTGPILAMGTITVVNESVFGHQPFDWRVPIATGLAAIGFGLAERAAPEIAELLAWTALVTVLFTRLKPNVPSPAENALTWWNSTGGSNK